MTEFEQALMDMPTERFDKLYGKFIATPESRLGRPKSTLSMASPQDTAFSESAKAKVYPIAEKLYEATLKNPTEQAANWNAVLDKRLPQDVREQAAEDIPRLVGEGVSGMAGITNFHDNMYYLTDVPNSPGFKTKDEALAHWDKTKSHNYVTFRPETEAIITHENGERLPGMVEEAYAKVRDPESKLILEQRYPELRGLGLLDKN